MTVYVAEISERGIVAFEAANDVDAATRLTDRTLLRDLRVLQNQGRSLWDGVSQIRLWESSPQELEIWQGRSVAATGVLVTENLLGHAFHNAALCSWTYLLAGTASISHDSEGKWPWR